MVDFDAMLGGGTSLDEQRAADAWKRIQQKPRSVVVMRDGTKLDPQTVRVEYSARSSETPQGAAGTSSVQQAIIFGIRGHATLPDTDLERSDRMVFDDKEWEVISTIYTTGELQATVQVLSS